METWKATVPFVNNRTGETLTFDVSRTFPEDTPIIDIDDELLMIADGMLCDYVMHNTDHDWELDVANYTIAPEGM